MPPLLDPLCPHRATRHPATVRITGMAFEWIGSTIAFGAVVKKP
jgi:hypothetical protein